MSINWSTFCRRPEEKKLEGGKDICYLCKPGNGMSWLEFLFPGFVPFQRVADQFSVEPGVGLAEPFHGRREIQQLGRLKGDPGRQRGRQFNRSSE
jgi:hypothetical protein